MILTSFDADEFERRAAHRLRREPPGILDPKGNPPGDHELELDGRAFVMPALPKPAAVLVPIVMHEEDATVLFTERASNLRDHSGQIAFPGGKIDAEDPSPLDTALREAEEEIGLERGCVRPLGYLDSYLSSSGYIVFPVVGLVSPRFRLTLNRHEVADAFEVPLGFLMDPNNHELHARRWKGRIRQYYAIPFRERYIWGVTAGILRNLYIRLYES
jgi:8-oxo-dGTP pyrophosphatase MutT (NUDIX family)